MCLLINRSIRSIIFATILICSLCGPTWAHDPIEAFEANDALTYETKLLLWCRGRQVELERQISSRYPEIVNDLEHVNAELRSVGDLLVETSPWNYVEFPRGRLNNPLLRIVAESYRVHGGFTKELALSDLVSALRDLAVRVLPPPKVLEIPRRRLSEHELIEISREASPLPDDFTETLYQALMTLYFEGTQQPQIRAGIEQVVLTSRSDLALARALSAAWTPLDRSTLERNREELGLKRNQLHSSLVTTLANGKLKEEAGVFFNLCSDRNLMKLTAIQFLEAASADTAEAWIKSRLGFKIDRKDKEGTTWTRLAKIFLNVPRILLGSHPFSRLHGRDLEISFNWIEHDNGSRVAAHFIPNEFRIEFNTGYAERDIEEVSGTFIHELAHALDCTSKRSLSTSPPFQQRSIHGIVALGFDYAPIRGYFPELITGYVTPYGAYGGAREDLAEFVRSYVSEPYLKCLDPERFELVRQEVYRGWRAFSEPNCYSSSAKAYVAHTIENIAEFYGLLSVHNVPFADFRLLQMHEADLRQKTFELKGKLKGQPLNGKVEFGQREFTRTRIRLSPDPSLEPISRKEYHLNSANISGSIASNTSWAILSDETFVMPFEFGGETLVLRGKFEETGALFWQGRQISGTVFGNSGTVVGTMVLVE